MSSKSENLLKRTLTANAVFSVLSGMVAVIFGAGISDFMSVNQVLLGVIGVGVLGFGIVVLMIARRSPIDLKAASSVVLADVLWVVIAIVLIGGFSSLMSEGGRWLFGLVSVVVAGFGVSQIFGIRRVQRANPKRLDTEVLIDADPDLVWSVLIDLPSYESWNPFVVQASGEVVEQARLDLRMSAPGGKAMNFSPKVTEVKESRTFEWFGQLGVGGLFDGRHRFDLGAVDGGTKLSHSESFSGFLVPFLTKTLDERTALGFDAMNQAIRRRVESMTQSED